MRIQNNVTAINSHRQYGINQGNTGKTMEKLSSGFRVNRAADDAAGLAISEKMRTQIRGLSQAGRNVQDGVSLLQVADGAMQIVHGILQRMRELAAQSANGTNEDNIDRAALDLEYQQLKFELDQVADTTDFNGIKPLKGFAAANPKNATFSTSGVSSPQINPADFNVPDAAGTDASGMISGANLNIPGPNGTYTVKASDLTANTPACTNFNLGPGVTLIIDNDIDPIPGPLNFSGQGSARVNGNVDGNVNVSGINNKVLVTGNITGTVSNQGRLSIGEPGSPVPFTGGPVSNAITGKLLVINSNVAIGTNNGDILFSGAGSTIDYNYGRVEVSGSGTDVHMYANHNVVLAVSDGGFSCEVNYDLIEVNGGIVVVGDNRIGGSVIGISGILQVNDNSAFVQFGKWDGDDVNPNGSTGIIGEVWINNPGATVRNFGTILTVWDHRDGSIVDNYGTLSSDTGSLGTGGTIRHHARGMDVSQVTNDRNADQFITFYINGQPIEMKAYWQQTGGGYELIFDPSDPNAEIVSGTLPADGDILFTSWPTNRVNISGIQYEIQGTVPIPDMTGTSGKALAYFLAEPLVIQSGANQGDETFLNFRALNAMYLGTEADESLHVHNFDNIGESDITTQDNAACCLTIIAKAINDVSIYRAELGAQYNRLEFKWDNINNTNENQAAAESRIRDADMAKEMTIFTKNNILNQSSTAMLAQANALPQGMLQLLG